MDTYEATKIVMSRIQNLDPENASKIMGYILIQDQGEKEILRLAFGPETLLLSCINQAKACLGLLSTSPSSNPSTPLSNPMRPNNPPFPQNKPRILIPNYGFHPQNNPSSPGFSRSSPRPISYAAVVNGSIGGNDVENSVTGSSSLPFYSGNEFSDDSGVEMPFLDDSMVDPLISPSGRSDSLVFPYGEDVNGVPSPHPHPFHRRSCSVNDAAFLSGFDDGGNGGGGWRPCMYFARGFCKNGSSCKFLHGGYGGDGIEVGSPSKIESGPFDEFLRIKALQQQQRFALSPHGNHHPLAYMKCPNFLNEHQRSAAAAALAMGDELNKFSRCRPDRNDFAGMGFMGSANSSARQIYLTFPADSTFKEEDVSNYFSMYGPVQDVRIPYQQKRMFGFVTFLYPETVKLILAKGNPHFVCDSRVLVKPYKEKGKVLEKKQQQMERGEFSAGLSPTGLDSREQFDVPFGSRMFYNTQEIMLRRKLEHEAEIQHAIDLQGRRMMNMQLMDMKSPHNHFLPNLSASAPIGSPLQSQLQMNQNMLLPPDGANQEASEEVNGNREAAKLTASDEDEAKECVNNNENGNKEDQTNVEEADFPESLEHILPDNLFASPTKLSAEHQSVFARSIAETDDGISVSMSSPSNIPALPNSNMASLKSYYFQMPRFSSGREAIEM